MSRQLSSAVLAGSALALAAVLVPFAPSSALACTTAVVSGSAAPDGRPLLWKNRDISTAANEIVRIEGGRFPLIAVVNCGSRSSIWMGVNSAGLCIENSLTKDLAVEGAKGPGNGGFMLQALQSCATVQEVKSLLEQTDATGRSTTACFGVIDAQGGAALFETAPGSHAMFDANDPEVAPHGYIVRSNFSYTGRKFTQPPTPAALTDVYSGERYLRASALLEDVGPRSVSAAYLLRRCARDLADADGAPYCGSVNGPAGTLPERIPTANTISRTTTVSFAVFQGVHPGEDPLLTTMWVGLGDPKFTVAVPCWLAAEEIPAELQGKKMSPLCEAAITLRTASYLPDENAIRTEGLPELWAEAWALEDATQARVERKLEEWRTTGIDAASMRALQTSAAEQALAVLQAHAARLPAPVPAAAQ
jgi:hypothetical protein